MQRYQEALRIQQDPERAQDALQMYRDLLHHPVLAATLTGVPSKERSLHASPVAMLRYVVNVNYALLLHDQQELELALDHFTAVR